MHAAYGVQIIMFRDLNSPQVPAHHLFVEALEAYQKDAGPTQHPLAYAIPPPCHLNEWVHQSIRATAALGSRCHTEWLNPPECCSPRPNDRPVWPLLAEHCKSNLCDSTVRHAQKYARGRHRVSEWQTPPPASRAHGASLVDACPSSPV
jgi:hypothetical protein